MQNFDDRAFMKKDLPVNNSALMVDESYITILCEWPQVASQANLDVGLLE
jgi:hypothetical protein